MSEASWLCVSPHQMAQSFQRNAGHFAPSRTVIGSRLWVQVGMAGDSAATGWAHQHLSTKSFFGRGSFMVKDNYIFLSWKDDWRILEIFHLNAELQPPSCPLSVGTYTLQASDSWEEMWVERFSWSILAFNKTNSFWDNLKSFLCP